MRVIENTSVGIMKKSEKTNISISVISPVYKAKEIIPELVLRLNTSLSDLTDSYEIILVDDCSPDDGWNTIKQLSKEQSNLKGLKLSKNAGQQKALLAGLEVANGDYLIVMDCDLQEDTSHIISLFHKIHEGYDMVLTKFKTRKFDLLRSSFTRFFYAILTLLTNSSFTFYNTGMLSIINRKSANAILSINRKNWFYLPALYQVGFKKAYIQIEHNNRHAGKSSYSFNKLFRHGMNLILGHSLRLLNLSIGIGLFFVLISFVWAVTLIVIYFKGTPPSGYTSMMVALLLFTGLILSAIGVLGLYIGKIFHQVKGDPDYFVDQTTNI